MSYSKNLPVWERVVRVLAGAAMVGGGILWMGRSMPLGIVLAIAG